MLILPLLEFKNVSYVNDNKTILKNLSVDIDSGDFIFVVGHSGSGKSTFFKLCSQLISPTEGDIIYKGRSFREYNPIEWRKSIAYCLQTPYLFGNTVMDNLKFPYSIRNTKIDMQRVEELLCTFRLDKSYLSKEVKNLSGGEKQRISLIRTLLCRPEILLLDEVTSALDADNTSVVENVIESINREGITVMWISHDDEQSKKYGNKTICIEDGEIKDIDIRGQKNE